jgi:hypothetical protein
MANPAKKMNCPRCGAEMNHHGDKVVYATIALEDRHIDSGLGGRLEEFTAVRGAAPQLLD